jgi:hypothetical protein
LIADDLFSVSEGFAVGDGGVEWHGNHWRVRRALIDHVAFLSEPAYEAARITAVRDRVARGAAPNPDRALELLLPLH